MKKVHGKQDIQPDDEIKLHWFLLGELFTWIGAGFIWPLTSVYLDKRLYVSLAMIGIVLFPNCLINILGSSVTGWAYDHFNPYYLIIAGAGLSALVLFGVAADHIRSIYWVWMTLTGPLSDWDGALINSIATSIESKPGRYILSTIYSAQNPGMVFGTSTAGYVYDYSVTILFVITASLFVIICISSAINYRPIIKSYLERKAQQNTDSRNKIAPMPGANLKLTIGFFITLAAIWLMYMNWESNLSVYMVSLGIPFHLYSLPQIINASTIVIVQAFLSRLPSTSKNLFHQVVFGVTIFAIPFVILTFAKDHVHFVFSMATLTLGESAAIPAMPTYANDLSPVESKGEYQGLTISASAIGRVLGPLLGGLVIDKFGYINLFIVAAAGIFMMLAIITPPHTQLKDKLKTSR